MADGERADAGMSGLLSDGGGEKSFGAGAAAEQPMDTAISQNKPMAGK
jgi:hypothetical protein